MKEFLAEQLMKYLPYYEKVKINKLLSPILKFLSLFFIVGYKIRLFLYKLNILKSFSLNAYVISIGNISSGGTGKTPIVIEAAKYFLSMGYKVAVLSRGYWSNIGDKVVLVSDGNDILTDYNICGDEPYLIAKSVPKAIVLVGKDRINNGKAAIKLGANVIILDDGFQYLKLKRNENILMIDSYSPFENGYVLPYGKLRELPDSILRSTAIIISNSNLAEIKPYDYKIILKYAPKLPITKISYKVSHLTSLNTKKRININEAKGMKVIAVSGIGNPRSFIDLLKRNEINVFSYITYPDHHKYNITDMEEIISMAKKINTENIVTTEKDAVKIEDLCQALPLNLWSTNLEIIWETSNLFEMLASKDNSSKVNLNK